MKSFSDKQEIKQLEKRKGGYYYLQIEAEVVQELSRQRATRLICILDHQLSFRCGLNHLGDGNFFIIIAGKHLDTLDKELGDTVDFEIQEDPNPLGVDIPEDLEALLAQDEEAKKTFDKMTDGKKRGLIHSINRIKDIDKRIQKSLRLLEAEAIKMRKN